MGKSIEERVEEAKREYEAAKRKFCETAGFEYKAAKRRGAEREETKRRTRKMRAELAAEKRSLEEEASRLCAAIDRLEKPQTDSRHTVNVNCYDFTLDELEEARRQEALRRHAEFEYYEELNRPSLVATLIMLAVEFYFIKNLFFSAPHSIGDIAIGIAACLFFLVYHFPDL